MAQQTSLLAPYTNFLRDFVFTYFPTTNWQRAFSINPTINFGRNVADADVEEHVLDKVGSYGSQLNRIIDAMTVLLATLDREQMTPQERRFIDRFEDLADQADEAAASFQGKRRHRITREDLNGLIDGIRSLERSDTGLYREFVERIYAALPPSPPQPRTLTSG